MTCNVNAVNPKDLVQMDPGDLVRMDPRDVEDRSSYLICKNYDVCVSVRRTLKSGLSLDVVQALGLNSQTAEQVWSLKTDPRPAERQQDNQSEHVVINMDVDTSMTSRLLNRSDMQQQQQQHKNISL